MIADFIYLMLGIFFGYVWCLNHKSDRERKTFEQIDEEVRNELQLNKNLVDSLKQDLAYNKRLLQACREMKK